MRRQARSTRRTWRTRNDGGYVTLETAVALPALVLVAAMCAGLVGVVAVQLQCTDAARVAVRAAARGEAAEVVQGAARSVAPRAAAVEVRSGGGTVTVVVRARPSVLGLVGIPVRASSTAAKEPGTGDGGRR